MKFEKLCRIGRVLLVSFVRKDGKIIVLTYEDVVERARSAVGREQQALQAALHAFSKPHHGKPRRNKPAQA